MTSALATNGEAKKRGVTPRSAIYAKISKKRELVLETFFELLESKNESVKLGAAKVLLNKLIPDLKATELKSQDNLVVKIVTADEPGISIEEANY